MPNIKSTENKKDKVNIKFNGDYNGFRNDSNKRKITINNVNDLNKNRIRADYNFRDDQKKKITSKY